MGRERERRREREPKPVLLKEGDIIELKKGNKVYAYIHEKYIYESIPKPMGLARTEVTIGEDRKGFNTDYLAGKYGVTKTSEEGGGVGMGLYDFYPNGHYVTCRRMLRNGEFGEVVSFYQTGCFTVMIEEIKPIGRFEIKYSRATTKRK